MPSAFHPHAQPSVDRRGARQQRRSFAVRINGRYAASTPTGFAEIVSDYFPIPHLRRAKRKVERTLGTEKRRLAFLRLPTFPAYSTLIWYCEFDMARIEIPTREFGEVTCVSDLLTHITKWNEKYTVSKRGYHSHAWFRGHSKRTYKLEPGVYRDAFTKEAQMIYG